MLCLNRLTGSIVAQHSAHVYCLTILIDSTKRNIIGHSGYEMSAFGVEVYYEIVFLWRRDTCFRTLVHASDVVVARFLGLTINR